MELNLYGKTETEKRAARMFQCREIVKEITNFGVDQSQIIRIIKLLALEIENREVMLDIVNKIKQYDVELEDNQSSIIT